MPANKLKFLRNPAGFTLVEMIADITLVGVMGLFSIQFITGAAESNRLASGQKGLLDDAKLAMEFMIREIRVANIITTTVPPGVPIVVSAGNDSITFNKFGGLVVDTNATQIRYFKDGTAIKRTSNGTNETTLADQVTAFTVTKSGDFYTLSMTLAGPNGENFTLKSGVRPRSSIS